MSIEGIQAKLRAVEADIRRNTEKIEEEKK